MRTIQQLFTGWFSLVLLVLVLWLFASPAQAQQVQWASRLLGVSSEYKSLDAPGQFGALQVLGRPSKLPAVGSSPCAWLPASEASVADEWVKVGFDTPMKIRQVVIAENYNAGTVNRIYAYDVANREYLIYTNTKDTTYSPGRVLNAFVKETPYLVTALKVTLKTKRIAGGNQIDAIGLSYDLAPVRAEIHTRPDAPKELKKENLGRGVNTVFEEICPVITPDGKNLYFTRPEQADNQDIFYSELQADGTFSMARRLPFPINTPQHNSSFSITPDGSTMLLNNAYHRDPSDTTRVRLSRGLSVTRRQGNTWGFPEQVRIRNYYNRNEFAEFSLAQNGRVLVMTAQRDDSYGSKDLYVSFLQADGTWSEPRNMGRTINTADTETSPFLASDGVTLYYSTPGLSGYGSMDIFVTRRLDDSWIRWTEPQNMGPAINTNAWDGYFTLPASGEFAYFVSAKNSLGGNDIFRVRLSKIMQPEPVALVFGNVYDAQDKKPVAATMEYQGHNGSRETGTATANALTGEYKLVLPLKSTYTLSVKAPGYTSYTEEMVLEHDSVYQEIRKDLYLNKIGSAPATPNKLDASRLEVGKAVVLHQILFEQGKYDLLSPSFAELDRMVVLMKENPAMEIRLEGHTDNQGDFMLNYELSKNRVIAVKQYLESKGVDSQRIQYKAYGGTQPIASNASEETRKKNRRVEFVVLKK